MIYRGIRLFFPKHKQGKREQHLAAHALAAWPRTTQPPPNGDRQLLVCQRSRCEAVFECLRATGSAIRHGDADGARGALPHYLRGLHASYAAIKHEMRFCNRFRKYNAVADFVP